jgi:hypothetical protein
MAYSRPRLLDARPSPIALTARMAGIGLQFAVEPDVDADIEQTLVHASEEGMDEGDLRVLAMLSTWLGVHRARVNVDRLVRAISDHPSARVRAYWSAIATWLATDRRFARLVKANDAPDTELLHEGNAFQIQRRGEDQRFAATKLRVPKGVLRDRVEDVLDPTRLAALHRGYRNRVQMGPTWRADVWTAFERDPDISVAECARRVRCSFAVAWEVAQAFALLRVMGKPTGWQATQSGARARAQS